MALHSVEHFDDRKTVLTPSIHPSAYVAPGAHVIGDVTLGENSSVWFNAVLRGDHSSIKIGANTNIQELCMCHVDDDTPLIIGDRVTVGHSVILHGCTIEDDTLIGMGAIVMDRAVIGHGSVVGAGALVLENFRCPPNSLVVGCPAKIKKQYTGKALQQMRDHVVNSYETYARNAKCFQESMAPVSIPSDSGTDWLSKLAVPVATSAVTAVITIAVVKWMNGRL